MTETDQPANTRSDDDDLDSCVCAVEIADTEISLDHDLPQASGGVEVLSHEIVADDGPDGCDVDFTKSDATDDENLPAATGGME